MFDEIAEALRSTDFVTPLTYLTRVLGGEAARRPSRVHPHHGLRGRERALTAGLAASHPDDEPFDIELLVGSLMSGLIVIYLRWVDVTGATDDVAARETWATLLEQLLDATRTGHRSVASSRRSD
ncbi:hypothetical protein NKG05_09960 [Oerskovia sp. M15]